MNRTLYMKSLNSMFVKYAPPATANGSLLKSTLIPNCQLETHSRALICLSRKLSSISSNSHASQSKHRFGLSQDRPSGTLQQFGTPHLTLPHCSYSSEPSCDDDSSSPANHSSTDSKSSEFKLVYTAPLKGAVRAVKVFSLSTATAAVLGGPILVWMGNPSVPLSGRVIMSSLVMLVGISTTALLHWLAKGYIIRMYYNEQTKTVQAYTLSLFGRQRLNEFKKSEAKPPSATAFSSFQARGKSYFVHTEVFEDKEVLSGLLGAYTDIETSNM